MSARNLLVKSLKLNDMFMKVIVINAQIKVVIFSLIKGLLGFSMLLSEFSCTQLTPKEQDIREAMHKEVNIQYFDVARKGGGFGFNG